MNSSNNQNYIPLEDFFRNPEKTAFRISPSGEYVSYLAAYENRRNIFIQKTNKKDSEPIRLTGVTERDISMYMWVNDHFLVYLQDNAGDENHHIFAVNIDTKETRDLTPFDNIKAEIVDDLENNPDEILIQLNQRNPQFFDVYRLNIKTAELEMVAENPGNVSVWHTDHEGNVRLAITTDGVNSSLLYRKSLDEPFENVLTTTFKEHLNPAFFTFDPETPHHIYAISNLDRDKSAAVIFDLENKKEVKELLSHESVDISGLHYSEKHKKLTAAHYTTDKLTLAFFDSKMEALYQNLKEKLGDTLEIFVTDANEEEDVFLVRTMSDRSLGAYYLYDLDSEQLTHLADVSTWLKAEQLAEMQPIKYTSRDGLTINGYLTLPVGVEAKNLPVVVNPHGGPWARDVWGFNPQVQFLANRGYAVLQMNFRGSTGYGRQFLESSFKQWGLAMQDDITDGVHWLIEEGIADADRVAIYGASYGGYATLAGVTFTPDLYACAIDYVGVSNLFTFIQTIPPYWKPFLEMMYEMVGHPETDKEQLEATSPVFHVDKIKAPLFVAQGAKDPRVVQSESDQVVEALRKRNVEVQYMVKENEGHGFQNEENKFEFYQAVEDFLAKHLQKIVEPVGV